MLNDLKTGEVYQSDGSIHTARSSKQGATVVVQGGGKYYEQVSRGHVYSMMLTAWTTTTAAGNLLAAAAAASTQFALWNPDGTDVNLSLLKFGVYLISGTTGIPNLTHSYAEIAPSINSTLLTPIRNNLVGASGGCQAKGVSSAAGTALTGGSALLVLRTADLSASAGTFANLGGTKAIEYIDGDIIILPGKMWVPTWAAAGSNTLGGYSITWAEVKR